MLNKMKMLQKSSDKKDKTDDFDEEDFNMAG
jgi:hypothetical protein